MREILRTTSARHRGQRKIGISMRAGISIHDVARELEVDIDLDSRPDGAEGDLKAYAHGPYSCSRRPRPPRRSSRRRRTPSTPPTWLPAPSCLLPRGVADNLSACPPPIPNPLADSCLPLRAPWTRSASFTAHAVASERSTTGSHKTRQRYSYECHNQRLSAGSHM